MAIYDKLPEIEVPVLVEGAPAVEYDETVFFRCETKKMLANMVVKYIPCIFDANFAFQCKVYAKYQSKYDSLNFLVSMDERNCGGLAASNEAS